MAAKTPATATDAVPKHKGNVHVLHWKEQLNKKDYPDIQINNNFYSFL